MPTTYEQLEIQCGNLREEARLWKFRWIVGESRVLKYMSEITKANKGIRRMQRKMDGSMRREQTLEQLTKIVGIQFDLARAKVILAACLDAFPKIGEACHKIPMAIIEAEQFLTNTKGPQ